MIKYQVPEYPILDNNRKLSKIAVVSLLKEMVKIRLVEQKIANEILEESISTPCHLYIGQEADAVGVCAALKNTDYVFSTHRSHGHFLAKGGKVDELFGEIYCRETGCSGGRGGSMHLCDPSVGLLGSSSIVAGCLGIGIGPALKSKILGLDIVSVIFHGDSVPEEGVWHESLNFAAVNKLPIIYVCENNLYAASDALESRRVFDNIPRLAAEHGLHTEIVDGNDVFAIYDAAVSAVERSRNGGGPQFIECRTYRWLGHVGPYDDIDKGLRNYKELDFWKRRCPIANLEKWMKKQKMISDEELEEIYKGLRTEIDAAEKRAIAAKKPDASTLLDHIYREGVL